MLSETFRVPGIVSPQFPDKNEIYVCRPVKDKNGHVSGRVSKLNVQCDCLPYKDGFDYDNTKALSLRVEIPVTIARQLLRDNE